MSDRLIDRLVADLEPVSRFAVQRHLIAATAVGCLASVPLVLLLGLRPDLAAAAGDAVFWVKLLYPFLIACLALAGTVVLARPGGRTMWPWLAMCFAALLLGLAALLQAREAPPAAAETLFWGSTALLCPLLVLLVSTPLLVSILAGMRRMAPTRPSLAGFAAGIAAGGAGAGLYALHCVEHGLPFLATWYNLGIALSGLAGAIAGRVALRW